MHRVGIPRQSSGGYPAFGLKNPFRTRGDYQVYFQIGHGGQILQNGLRQRHPARAADSKDKAMHRFFFSVTLSAYRTMEHGAACRHELTPWRSDGHGYCRRRLDDLEAQGGGLPEPVGEAEPPARTPEETERALAETERRLAQTDQDLNQALGQRKAVGDPAALAARREELALSRPQLADRLGVTPSTVSNYETGVSFPKEEMMLRLFDCLETDPNTLFQDSFRRGADVLTERERQLLEQYRSLSPLGRESVQTMVEALRACQQESAAPEQEPRVIPLYRTPAAAGYAAPVFGEDFDYLQVTDGVPQAAEFAVRIQGDSMVPYIPDGSVVYVNRDPLKAGDVGIFCVDGDIFCKQYYKDPAGTVYLFSLNRARADADVVLTAGSGRTLACFGRVILHALPLPGRT